MHKIFSFKPNTVHGLCNFNMSLLTSCNNGMLKLL